MMFTQSQWGISQQDWHCKLHEINFVYMRSALFITISKKSIFYFRRHRVTWRHNGRARVCVLHKTCPKRWKSITRLARDSTGWGGLLPIIISWIWCLVCAPKRSIECVHHHFQHYCHTVFIEKKNSVVVLCKKDKNKNIYID